METNVVVPAGHTLDGVGSGPVHVYDMSDGLGVLLGIYPSIVKVRSADHERELMFRSDVLFQNFVLKDVRGFEEVDPTPVEIPVRLATAPSMRDQVVEQISRYLFARAKDEGFESLEEAMDFDVEGEVDELQTRAETSFIASFMPHQGRAANSVLKRDEKPVEKPVKPEVPKPEMTPEVPVTP